MRASLPISILAPSLQEVHCNLSYCTLYEVRFSLNVGSWDFCHSDPFCELWELQGRLLFYKGAIFRAEPNTIVRYLKRRRLWLATTVTATRVPNPIVALMYREPSLLPTVPLAVWPMLRQFRYGQLWMGFACGSVQLFVLRGGRHREGRIHLLQQPLQRLLRRSAVDAMCEYSTEIPRLKASPERL